MKACKRFLWPNENWPSSTKIEGSLTARPTRRAKTKFGLRDLTIPSGKIIAQQIKGSSNMSPSKAANLIEPGVGNRAVRKSGWAEFMSGLDKEFLDIFSVEARPGAV
ncbi:hypothetical protein GOBAR_AA23083 [Gossypium barbadense]|uniref:Uncharacterized protein n=1 Tax=Gossypium barbadense TaxID=3634 RepID=A0A2P5X2M0_GOSBA|nr:hypothetical protein GOBAR_AA23083 [Gossypium barbadense]